MASVFFWLAFALAFVDVNGVAAQTLPIANSTNRLGEILVQLKSGESTKGVISYGLYYISSASRAASNAPPGSDLILVLRNSGAKWIDFEGVTVENFSLRDADGKEIKIVLRSDVRGIGYGQSEVVHLTTSKPAEAPEPWTLSLKTSDAFVPLDLSISGIQFPKPAQHP
jgi:hypothetical protein